MEITRITLRFMAAFLLGLGVAQTSIADPPEDDCDINIGSDSPGAGEGCPGNFLAPIGTATITVDSIAGQVATLSWATSGTQQHGLGYDAFNSDKVFRLRKDGVQVWLAAVPHAQVSVDVELTAGTNVFSLEGCNYNDSQPVLLCTEYDATEDLPYQVSVPDLFDVSVEHHSPGNVRYRWDYSVEAQRGYVVKSRWRPIHADGSHVSSVEWSPFEHVCDGIPSNGEPDVDVGYLSGVKTCVDVGDRDREYQVIVEAYFEGGLVDAASPNTALLVPVTYPDDVGPLGAQTNSGSVTVSWSASSGSVARYMVEARRRDIGGTFPETYLLQDCAESAFPAPYQHAVVGTQCTVANLVDGDWQFRVSAENGALGSPIHTATSLALGGDQYHVRALAPPGEPVFSGYVFADISGDNLHTSGSYMVDWAPPDAGGRITGFELREFYRPFGGTLFEETVISPMAFSESEASFAPATRLDGHYYYEIRGINEVNPAADNAPLQTPVFKVVKSIDPPVGLEVLPSGVSATGSFDLTWDASPEPSVAPDYELDVRYQVFVCAALSLDDGCTSYQEIVRFNSPHTLQTVIESDLSGNGFYQFKVRANYEGNFSDLSAASEAVQVLLPPELISAPVVTQGTGALESEFNIAWQSPAGTVDHYALTYSANGVSHSDYSGEVVIEPEAAQTGPDAYAVSLPLINLANHEFTLKACNVASCNAGTEFEQLPAHPAPHAPTAFTAVGLENSVDVELSWQPDESLTDYVLLTVFNDGLPFGDATEIAATNSWTVSLPFEGYFEFELQACNRLLDATACSGSVSTAHTVDFENAWSAKGGTMPSQSLIGAVPLHDPTVGAVAGEGGADGGNAYYRIPINVVPGRNGMQPEISVSYSSGGGEGLLGVGWSIDAYESIGRCGSTVTHDGVSVGVQYSDTTDRLCLNGERLQVVNGVAYGTAAAVYRPDGGGLTRITQIGGSINQSPSFKVEYENGRTAFFGDSLNSKHRAGRRPEILTWAMSHEKDSSGNRIDYVYSAVGAYGTGEHLLEAINYTGFGETAGNRTVEFLYEDLPAALVHRGYAAGGVKTSTQRLKEIRTSLGSDVVRRYRFDFGGPSRYSGRLLLRAVTECAGETDAICFSPTHFKWSESELQYDFERLTYNKNGTIHTVGDGVVWMDDALPHADEDGDGVGDFPDVFVNADGKWTGDRSGVQLETCFRDASALHISCLTADFNGDGLTDKFRVSNENTIEIKYTPRPDQADGAWIPTPIKWRGIGSPNGHGPNDTGFEPLLNPGSVLTKDERPLAFSDFNGDGWVDVAVREAVDGANYELVLYFHTQNASQPYSASIGFRDSIFAFETQHSIGFPSLNNSVQFIGDMNGDGTLDFVEYDHYRLPQEVIGTLDSPSRLFYVRPVVNADGPNQVALSHITLPSYITVAQPFNTDQLRANSLFMDINADGLPDWLLRSFDSPGTKAFLNTGDGFEADWVDLGLLLPTAHGTDSFPNHPDELFAFSQIASSKTLVHDYNGDGRQDLLVAETVAATACSRVRQAGGDIWPCNDEMYEGYRNSTANYALTPIPAEYKDDSLRRYRVYYFDSDATGGVTYRTEMTDIYASASQRVALDVFGDGQLDILTTVGCRQADCTLEAPLDPDSPVSIAFRGGDPIKGIYINRNRGAARAGERYRAPDMLEQVINGVGTVHRWEYRPLSSGPYVDLADVQSTYPFYAPDYDYVFGGDLSAPSDDYFHFGSSMYVVAEHATSHSGLMDLDGDGYFTDLPTAESIDALNRTVYRYGGATLHKKGRGFAGFRSIVVEDLSKGLKTNTLFHQKWPKIGMVERACTMLSGEEETVLTGQSCDLTALVDEHHTYLTGVDVLGAPHRALPDTSVTITRDLVSRVTVNESSQQMIYDAVGLLDTVTTISNDIGSSLNSSTSDFDYAPVVSNATWWPKKLVRKQVTKARPQRLYMTGIDPDVDPLEMSTVTTFNYAGTEIHRKPHVVTVEGLHTTTFSYSQYGLPREVTVAGVASRFAPRTTRTEYEPTGYYSESVFNALDQRTQYVTDARFGSHERVIDSNGLVTSVQLDAFGFAYRTDRLGAPPAYVSKRWCAADCATGAVTQVVSNQEGSPDSVIDLDARGRALKTSVAGFDGPFGASGTIISTRQYDRDGYERFVSVPHFDGDLRGSIGTRYEQYDRQGRLLRKAVDQANGGRFVTSYTHSGLTTNILAAGLSLSRTYDSSERLLNAVDASGGTTTYAYDANGNPIVIRDAATNEIVAKYDNHGRKMYVLDPNMGRKDFTYSPFGEVQSELDASNNEIRFAYDPLGRMVGRYLNQATNPEALWIYDSFDGQRHDGALFREEKIGQMAKSYTVDALGRVVQTDYWLGDAAHTYSVRTSYDANYGRVTSVAYPNGLVVGTEYTANGYALRDINAASSYVLREYQLLDERGNPTLTTLNSGQLVETIAYYGNTGQMANVDVSGPSGRLHAIDYAQYDIFGNLSKQVMSYPGEQAIESFEYDELHRLTKSTRTFSDGPLGSGGVTIPDTGTHGSNGFTSPVGQRASTVSYSYDAVGNLKSKSDFGRSYHYGEQGGCALTPGPNAVSSIERSSGEVLEYCYDERGNQISGAGRGLTYNQFNHPTHIAQGGSQALFWYGADLQRFRQTKTNGGESTTTHYVDKLTEIVETAQSTQLRNYIGRYAIFAETINHASGARSYELNFLHRDRLGSVATVTNHAGEIVERRGFDPFGKPREGSWRSRSPATLNSPNTDRGFTGHEHLDDVQLIHMNGRVYDYNAGRFLSVDPFIQAPDNSQSVNGYSYIMNNPLAGTDPTGYKACGEVIKKGDVCQIKVRDRRSRRAPRYKTYTVAHNGAEIFISEGQSRATFDDLERQMAGLTGLEGPVVGPPKYRIYERNLSPYWCQSCRVQYLHDPSQTNPIVGYLGDIFGVLAGPAKNGYTYNSLSGGIVEKPAEVRVNLLADLLSMALPMVRGAKLSRASGKLATELPVPAGEVRFQRWRRGEAIDKPLPDGSAPSWDVVRSRYWKNRASASNGEFSADNLARMRQGRAPVDYNARTGDFEPRELHHVVPQRFGGSNSPLNLRELTPDQHGAVDPFRHTVPTTRGIR